ncbi:hypothetical protein KTI78_12845 [Acinetobacter sp. WU_MDCI_Abxe161]|uniref:hypothetical protein n=1 Tax=Acinetobacter sp. WU_MDCI_Abxe161 TaxID=2850074 RepID=UPI0021CD38E0|nr:hypothetical protein [Acinetobacter sp. WU_MDCI_Abxe161]MCU4504053.1 hypothetical protein [Acinetobacter sp. WU_MDCI_Abxe161]
MTTDPRVAEYFATNEGERSGTVYELKVEFGRAIKNKFNKKMLFIGGKWVSEEEWLVPRYIKPSEVVGRRRV